MLSRFTDIGFITDQAEKQNKIIIFSHEKDMHPYNSLIPQSVNNTENTKFELADFSLHFSQLIQKPYISGFNMKSLIHS